MRFLMRSLATAIVSANTLFVPNAIAVQLQDGTVYFDRPPSLEYAAPTIDTARSWGSTHYFTLRVSPEAGEPLQRVEIQQRQGLDDDVRYDLEDTRSFTGTRRDRGTEVPLGEVTHDRDTQTVSVTFAEAIEPGTTVTIGLRPVRNPEYSGIYLYGVTVFPAGEKTHGQYIGVGRFHIRRSRSRFAPIRLEKFGGKKIYTPNFSQN